jgi:cyclophilin family peptidyl-prolyl cis-trans isomerase
MTRCAIALVIGLLAAPGGPITDRVQRSASPALPTILIETAKGSIEIELFRADAPKSVEHILGLVRRGFYRGLRFHRVTASLAQVGDPLSRDMSKDAYWGTGGSGDPIGVAEISARSHLRGTVALAHSGDPKLADSQFYIMKTVSPSLDGKYAVIGRVTQGMDVVDRLARADVVRNASVKGEGAK